MGRKVQTIELSDSQRTELRSGYKEGSANFSKRCHMILLKSENRSSREVASLLMTNQVSVNNWMNRYKKAGIAGLQTKAGQGRKAILNKEHDEKKVREAIKNERQRLKHAKEELEQTLGKSFSLRTLKRFLKNVSADGNGFD